MRGARRSLSILYVAYPLLTVSDESAGGAEQMLVTLERQMTTFGHRTVVAAPRESRVSGELLDTGEPADALDRYEAREAEHCARVLDHLREGSAAFDLIHDESGSFWRHAGECEIPVLATLHLPRSFYNEEWFRDLPANLFFNCVSESQARSFADLPNLVSVVPNGISLDWFLDGCLRREERQTSTRLKPPHDDNEGASGHLLWLGRICEEKGPDLAIEVARQAGLPLVIAGQVYPFSYHQDYFEREIKPWLSDVQEARVRFVDSPSFDRKIELLRSARAVLLTSTAEETSSLVAMEAMACGTPVVALGSGAFPEIVADGVTGFVVETLEQMAEAVRHVDQISAEACREWVKKHFTAERMAREYEDLYRRVLREAQAQVVA